MRPAGVKRGRGCRDDPAGISTGFAGTCAGFYAAQYLKTRGLPTTGLAIEVHAEKAMQPARIGSFRIEILLPDLADREKHEPGILRAVKACLVHNTLIHEPGIETVLKLG